MGSREWQSRWILKWYICPLRTVPYCLIWLLLVTVFANLLVFFQLLLIILVSGFFFNVFHQISEIILNYHTLRTYWLPPKIKGVVKAPSNNLSLNIQIALCLSAFQGYLVHDLTHLLRCHLGVNLRGGNVLVFQIRKSMNRISPVRLRSCLPCHGPPFLLLFKIQRVTDDISVE